MARAERQLQPGRGGRGGEGSDAGGGGGAGGGGDPGAGRHVARAWKRLLEFPHFE